MSPHGVFRAGLRIAAGLVFCACACAWGAAPSLLLRNPSLSQDRIAFLYADDIWTVPREGGEARRLTSGGGVAAGPFFSPDQTQIAYSTRMHGLTERVRGERGRRRAAAAHVGAHRQPCGRLDRRRQGGPVRVARMRAIRISRGSFGYAPTASGPAQLLPLPSAAAGSFSADGNTLAYVPFDQWQTAWKHYRGGQTTPVWLVNLKTLELEKIPRENSNDSSPVWSGRTVYFLSDRNGPVSLFSYDPGTKQVQQVIENQGFDLKTVSAGPGALVYEQFGSLHLYDLATHQEHAVPVTIHGDLPS